jgi:hypothetical protein
MVCFSCDAGARLCGTVHWKRYARVIGGLLTGLCGLTRHRVVARGNLRDYLGSGKSHISFIAR